MADAVDIELVKEEEVGGEVLAVKDRALPKVRFDGITTDAAIEIMREEYLPLSITSPKDKDIYTKVRESRLFVSRIITAIEKRRKTNNAAYQNANNGEAERITGLLSPLKAHLEKEEGKYDAWAEEARKERERIKQEAERLEQERLHGRINGLLALGMAYTGFSYAYGEHSVTAEQLKVVSDEFFNNLLDKVKASVEEEQARVAEEERLKKEEEEAERLRLEEIEKEKEAAKKKAEEIKQAEQKAEDERLAKIKEEQAETARIQAERDAAFEKESALFEAEKEAVRERERKLAAEKKEDLAVKVAAETINKVEALTPSEANAKAEEHGKEDGDTLIESEEQIALRLEREKELKPDRDKLNVYADKLMKVALPKIKSAECLKALNDAYGFVEQAVEALRNA